MVRVKVAFVNQEGGAPVEKTFDCKEASKPSMPMWAIRLTNGNTLLLNMPMILWLEIEDGVIQQPEAGDVEKAARKDFLKG